MTYTAQFRETESSRCYLCYEASCSKACSAGIDPADIIRSLHFGNADGAAIKAGSPCACASCSAPCEDVCIRGKVDAPVRVRDMILGLSSDYREKSGRKPAKKPDLSVTFCGVRCENPYFLSSSIVGSNYDMIAKAFEMGWAGAAFKTIGNFIPEETSPRFSAIGKEDTPFVGFKNVEQISDHSLEENCGYIRKLKKNYPSKVIIASIMGRTEEEWTYLAGKVEEAGADIVECNFSCPHMSDNRLGSDVGTHPETVAAFTRAVKKGTSLPILAKMTPNITNIEPPAEAAIEAGAAGIAAINTVKSIMNIDLDSFVSEPSVRGKSSVGGYSGKAIKPIALRFISDLSHDEKLAGVPISGMGGIETWRDAAEFLALGCETVQVTTSVMQYGYRVIDDMIDGLERYLMKKGYDSVRDLIGKAVPAIVPSGELDRKSIEYPHFDREVCVGCGRCFLSCYDGGHQAIRMRYEGGCPVLDVKKCVGCQLCRLVCPVGAITAGKRVSVRKDSTPDARETAADRKSA